MALTIDEKKLLQLALCDGYFKRLGTPNGVPILGNVTPDILNFVNGLSDDDLRAHLRQYQENKAAKLSAVQASLETLQDIQITDAA